MLTNGQEAKAESFELQQLFQALPYPPQPTPAASTLPPVSEPLAKPSMWYPLVRKVRLANGEIKLYIDLNAPLSQTPQTVDEDLMGNDGTVDSAVTSPASDADAPLTPSSKSPRAGWGHSFWPAPTGSGSANSNIPPSQQHDLRIAEIYNTIGNLDQLLAVLEPEKSRSDTTTPRKRRSHRDMLIQRAVTSATISGRSNPPSPKSDEQLPPSSQLSCTASDEPQSEDDDRDSDFSIGYDGSDYESCPDN
ncbi:hypothetical protein H4R34_003658 [Dimargaris verticillata]|uniref:Uncharacterized protein n=1 Tax=Dimargaris verticillata TaxID=2761393 RepID=A0A9W8EBU0_9FUNG|nr:hypothetical protein H4R34_003658 [Dimargaris verticillata]